MQEWQSLWHCSHAMLRLSVAVSTALFTNNAEAVSGSIYLFTHNAEAVSGSLSIVLTGRSCLVCLSLGLSAGSFFCLLWQGVFTSTKKDPSAPPAARHMLDSRTSQVLHQQHKTTLKLRRGGKKDSNPYALSPSVFLQLFIYLSLCSQWYLQTAVRPCWRWHPG